MKHISLPVLVCLGVAAFAQQVHFDYDRSANFSAYKTYQWVDYQEVPGRRPDPGSGHQTRGGCAARRQRFTPGREWR